MKSKTNPRKVEYVLWGGVFCLTFLFTSHPDLWETANHSYLLWESLMNGEILNYYHYVAGHPFPLYYTNNAHYNIVVYFVFALWQLPIFLFNQVFSLPVYEPLLWLWTKALCVGFYFGCGYMIYRLCKCLCMPKKTSFAAAVFFLFNPIAFFSPMVMGQYDSLCLFFMLWALLYYLQGDYTRFTLLMGVAGIFKFFAFLPLIPLLLLQEKRILSLVKYALMSLWLYIPSSLLYLGRTGNADTFTQMMFERLFSLGFASGFAPVSFFLFCYAILCFACYLYTKDIQRPYLAFYVPLLVYGLLFFSIYWHPQWIILLVPFLVITTFMQKNVRVFLYLDFVLCFGFFLTCFFQFPYQMGAHLFTGGLFTFVSGQNIALHAEVWNPISFFLALIPNVNQMAPLAFSAAVFAHLIFKFPLHRHSLADTFSDKYCFDRFSLRAIGYALFLVGFVGFWVLPSLFEHWNAFGLI